MTHSIHDDFSGEGLSAYWTPLELGGAAVQTEGGALRLLLSGATGDTYSDAQITDYAGLRRRDFLWSPPLRMTVRARASHGGHALNGTSALKGTAGFGFWNSPMVPFRRTLPRLPRAVWFFFGGPPNNMALALDQPGYGWKAATFDATRPAFFGLLPLAPLGFLLMRIPALYRRLWPFGQRAIGVAEAHLPDDLLAETHDYSLTWRRDGVTFAVDGRTVLETPRSPRGPLGFVAWIDNQYAIVTPQGRFGWGYVDCEEQWLLLERVTVEGI